VAAVRAPDQFVYVAVSLSRLLRDRKLNNRAAFQVSPIDLSLCRTHCCQPDRALHPALGVLHEQEDVREAQPGHPHHLVLPGPVRLSSSAVTSLIFSNSCVVAFFETRFDTKRSKRIKGSIDLQDENSFEEDVGQPAHACRRG
jgi:hypothetical protein